MTKVMLFHDISITMIQLFQKSVLYLVKLQEVFRSTKVTLLQIPFTPTKDFLMSVQDLLSFFCSNNVIDHLLVMPIMF